MSGPPIPATRPSPVWVLALAGVVILAAGLRLPAVQENFLFGDEFASLRLIDRPYDELVSTYGENGSGLALPFLQRLLSDLLGRGHWAFRLPALLGGLAAVTLVFAVGRGLVGAPAALLAAFALALNPQQIFYSHFGRSYALVAALGLVLVGGLRALTDSDTPAWRARVAVVVATGLLPWAHVTSLALVVAASTGALASVAWSRSWRRWPGLLGSLLAGGALAVALHAPALPSLLSFLRTKSSQEYYGSFSILDVFALLAGGRLEGGMLLVGALLAGGLWVVRRRRDLVLPAAALGTPLLVLLANAYGGPYAQARYMLVATALMLLLLSWLVRQVVDVSPAGWRISLWGASFALVLGSFALGPRGPLAPDDGPFGNTYLALLTLPPFDTPSPKTSPFFRDLARDDPDARIIEAPWLPNRSVHLYRNIYLQHPRPTALGLLGPGRLKTWVPDGPYVPLFGPGWHQALDADYLVVHRRIRREVEEYWRTVYGPNLSRTFPSGVSAYMERHRVSRRRRPSMKPEVERRLRAAMGAIFYEDEYLLVWRLGS